MINWLWIVLLSAGAAMACFMLWLYSNRKKIFKKRSKDEKKAKKSAKKIKKQEKVAKKEAKKIETPPLETKKEEDSVSFKEKIFEVSKDVNVEGEQYVPSGEFVKNVVPEYVGMVRRMPRRRPVEAPAPQPTYEVTEQRMSLKEQLLSLSPEMKAVVFGNLLDRKDEQF